MYEEDFNMKKTVRGMSYLFVGRIISFLVSLVGSLIVIRFLNPYDYGLLQISLSIPFIFSLFSDWGILQAVSRYVAKYRTSRYYEEIGNVIYSALFFKLFLSLILTIICYVSADFLTITLFHKPEIAQHVRISSFIILSEPLYTVAASSFLGFEMMELLTFFSVLQQFLTDITMPIFIFMGFRLLGVVTGVVAVSFLSGFIGLAIFFFFIARPMKISCKMSIKTLNNLFKFGFPLALSGLFGNGLARYYDFMTATYCPAVDIGNYKAAAKIGVIQKLVTNPVSLVLLPAFSKLNVGKDEVLMDQVLGKSVKYLSLFLVPIAISFIVLSKSFTRFFFGIEYNIAWLYLVLISISWLFIGFGGGPISNFLVAQGETQIILRARVLTVIIGGAMAFFLIPTYGIIGFFAADLTCSWPAYIILLKKAMRYGIHFPFKRTMKVYISSLLAVASIMPIVCLSNLTDVVRLVVSALIFLCVYLSIVLKSGVINREELEFLKSTFDSIPYINRLIKFFINLFERLLPC